MTKQSAICISNLSKRYRLGQGPVGDHTMRDAITATAGRLFKRHPAQRVDESSNVLWALRDVGFDVEQGEAIGIIGCNGAGKSTLLKVLARITSPTQGRIELRGRVASLLEVGTGFHPELTGRENIFLNGAVLGMSRKEVRSKYNDIVSFSGIERFLDTPVKRYSSGMRVRLAFAVAAHLDPAILIVDEVLAVGDAAFQQRCLGKMHQFAEARGRTVLLVSHNMSVIRNLCRRAVLLDQGRVAMIGDAGEVVESYCQQQNHGAEDTGCVTWDSTDAPEAQGLRLLAIKLQDANGIVRSTFTPQDAFDVVIEYELTKPMAEYRWDFQLRTGMGDVAFTSSDQSARQRSYQQPGRYQTVCHVPGELLNNGQYIVRVWSGIPNVCMLVDMTSALSLTVTGIGNHGSTFGEGANWPGVMCPRLDWSISRVEERVAA